MMKIKNDGMLQKIEDFYEWHNFCISVLLFIVITLMILHFNMFLSGYVAIAFLWLFMMYFIWYDQYGKEKFLPSIPIWLSLIVYYAINWDTMCKMFKIIAKVLFG